MEQRPLRLGDIVDDYCPRERRVTNHAIVAIVDDAIRQTRCTTCDAEHAYKGAKEPRLRKKPAAAELDNRALADVTNGPRVAKPTVSDPTVLPQDPPDVSAPATHLEPRPSETPDTAAAPGEADTPAANTAADDVWPAHRQLIRATLPRADGDQPAPRPIPEFTMHQRPPARSGRGFRHSGNGSGNMRNGFPAGRPGQHSGRRHRRKRSR
jgi:hypothetical protein